jgi:SAM-dependent methyltransferase
MRSEVPFQDTVPVKETLIGLLRRFHLYEPLRGLRFDIQTFVQWCRYAADFNTHLRNARYRKKGAADGLPLPSTRMVYLVTGQYSLERFYEIGRTSVECITGILKKNGLDISRFETILDFGCGCGRVMRHWHSLSGPRLYGTDYNPYPISWCHGALPFAEFGTNDSESQLPYKDNSLDFVYAISVFSHLTHALQIYWMGELLRVLKPGGYFYMTVPGRDLTTRLSSLDRNTFSDGNVVVLSGNRVGTNACIAYTPETYVRQVLAKGFEIVDFIERGALDAQQDVFLMKKHVS